MDSDYKQAQSVSSESSARNNAIMIQMKDLVALGKAEQAAHMKTKQLFADAANRAETSQKELEETTVLKQLLEEQNSEVEKQNKALLGDIAQKAQKLAAMEKAAVVAAAEMSDANVLKQDLLKEKETLEKRNSDLAVALEKSQTELGALKYKLLTAEDLGQSFALEGSNNAGDLKSAQSTVKQLEQQNKASKLEVESLTLQITELEQNIAFGKKGEANLRDRLSMKETEFEQAAEQKTHLESEIQKLRKNLKDKTLSASSSGAATTELQAKFKASHARVLELERETIALKQAAAKEGSAKSEMDAAMQSMKAEHEGELKSLESERDQLRKMMQQLEKNMESHKDSSEQLLQDRDTEIVNLRKENLRMQTTLDGQTIKIQRLQKSNLEEDKELHLLDRKALETLVNDLRADRVSLTDEKKLLTKKLADVQNSLVEIETEAQHMSDDDAPQRGRSTSVLDLIRKNKEANPDSYKAPSSFVPQKEETLSPSNFSPLPDVPQPRDSQFTGQAAKKNKKKAPPPFTESMSQPPADDGLEDYDL